MSNNNIVLQGGSNTMYQNLKKKSEGFTIIEVLIVLAIAGLIMLIVFLAIPALQRNSRNNARNNDGSRISAAVSECLSNRNNQPSQCSGANITTVRNLAGNMSQLTTIAAAGDSAPSTSTAVVAFKTICTDAGTATNSTNDRDFTITYQLEGSNATVPRCIDSQG